MKKPNRPYRITGKDFYRWFVVIGIAVVLLIVFLAISFFNALKQNQIESRQVTLNKQIEIAGNDLQKNFTAMYDDMLFFVNNLEPWTYDRTDNEQLAFEKRARRIFNNHRELLDSIIVTFPHHRVGFHFDPTQNFVKDIYPDDYKPKTIGSTDINLFNPNKNVGILVKPRLPSFFRDQLANFYLGQKSEKLIIADGSIIYLDGTTKGDSLNIDPEVWQDIQNDLATGLKGAVIGYNIQSEKRIKSTIHYYPFNLFPLEGKYGLVFIQDISMVGVDVYNSYFFILFGLLVLLIAVLLILYKFIKSTQHANLILAKNSDEINELFRRQTLLLQESKGFIYFQNEKHEMTSVGDEIETVLGYRPEEFIHTFKNYIPSADLKRMAAQNELTISNKREVLTMEFDIRRKDGHYIKVKIFEKLLYNAAGDFIGNVGICTDIQEKYDSEQEIIRSENRLRAVLNSLPDLIFIYDHEGVFVDYYISDDTLLLYPAHTSMGKCYLDILPEPVLSKFDIAFKKTMQTGFTQYMEFELVTPKGKRIFEARVIKLDDQRIMSLARDITAQKLWEKGLKEAKDAAESANIAKSEFLANMSHEIRTPMNGLLGIIGLLENTELTTKQKEYLQVIRESGRSLSSIINDILDYSKIESGMMALNITDFHFKDEIEKVFKILSGIIYEKKIQFTYKFGPIMPDFIQLDKDKLNQILLNLLGNAVKFTPKNGKIHVNINVESVLKENVILYFEIIDTGKGIPSEKLAGLTDPFVQVDSSPTREYSGTGLGLAISKKLIELMGGDLVIQSEEEVGSTFSFSLFGKVVPEEQSLSHLSQLGNGAEENTDTLQLASRMPLSIFLVEDNDTNLTFMQMLMEQLGYEMVIARNGVEAVDRMLVDTFDLILMDIQMPKLNGLEATKSIRNLPNGKDVKIVGLSANAFIEDIEKAKLAGMDDYLTKPISVQELIKVIKKCFEYKMEKEVN